MFLVVGCAVRCIRLVFFARLFVPLTTSKVLSLGKTQIGAEATSAEGGGERQLSFIAYQMPQEPVS